MAMIDVSVYSEREDCTCVTCSNACTYKPGWFLPGEAERVADHLGLSLDEVFRTKLAVDYGEGDEPIFVLSPATVNNEPGEEFPYDPRGRCVFFGDDGHCQIHAVKPHECRAYIHTQSKDDVDVRHKAIAQAWTDHQAQIAELLGREPIAEEGEGFGLFGGLWGW